MKFSEEVRSAKEAGTAIVALESTVISHGLPFPENLKTAKTLEQIVRDEGATPATIAVIEGDPRIGLSDTELEFFAVGRGITKLSMRDLPIAAAANMTGATTVATTMFFAKRAGIEVFATGGIGGVHRGNPSDVSADLPALAQTPMITVCSGAKIILDLTATRERLETDGVTVLGYQTDQFPAFYSQDSGLKVDQKVESIDEIATVSKMRDKLRLPCAILLCNPVPKKVEIDSTELESLVEESLRLADEQHIQGKALTPFLLSQLSKLSDGRTIAANIALLENNAQLAAKVAISLAR